MPRLRFTMRRMMIVVAIVALLLPIERVIFIVVMSAHTDATQAERISRLLALNLAGLSILGVVWLWRRYARYD